MFRLPPFIPRKRAEILGMQNDKLGTPTSELGTQNVILGTPTLILGTATFMLRKPKYILGMALYSLNLTKNALFELFLLLLLLP